MTENLNTTEPVQTPEPVPEVPKLFPSWLSGIGRFSIEIAEVVIFSLAIILPIRYFLIQPFYVHGASMEPNFDNNQYLIIDELSYRFKPVARGDVIVLRYPVDPKQHFIKRVIGLPGEMVTVKDGLVYVRDVEGTESRLLDESAYLPQGVTTSGDLTITLAYDEYFVMGDNRGGSMDSRVFGPLPRSGIVGRVWVRGWPIDRFTTFESQKPKHS